MRQLKTIDEFFDLIANMRSGAKVGVGYISSAKLPKTAKSVKWDKFETDDYDKEIHDKINSLKNNPKSKFADIGINGIVKVSQFTTNWQTNERFKKNKANAEKAREDFLTDHGVDKTDIDAQRVNQGYETIDYGKNGIRSKVDKEGNTRTYAMLNSATSKYSSSKYYLIDNNGTAISEMSYNQIKTFIYDKKQEEAEANEPTWNKIGVEGSEYMDNISDYTASKNTFSYLLDKVEGDTRELKRWYAQFCHALKMEYREYRDNNFLYIVGTIDKEPFIYINTAFNGYPDTADKKLYVNPSFFIKIAKEKANALNVDTSWMDELQNESKKIQEKEKLIESCKKEFFDTFNKIMLY